MITIFVFLVNNTHLSGFNLMIGIFHGFFDQDDVLDNYAKLEQFCIKFEHTGDL